MSETLEQQVANLVTATTALTDAVNVKKTTLDTSVAAAGTSESNAAGSATASANSAAASAADRVLAESAKTAAQTAEANAVAVVSGGTAELVPAAGKIPISGATNKIDDNWLAYNIPALTAQYPGLVAVASCFYDTSKDSDGGAWIHRTAELSYGKEARPAGRYLGQYATATAAAGVTNAVVDDWYYNTNDKKFYKLIDIGTPAHSEIYRAGSAHFPAQAVIVAEAGRVIIFDVSGHQMTMWMVFTRATTSYFLSTSQTVSSLVMREGVLYIGTSSTGTRDIHFLKDRAYLHRAIASDCKVFSNNIAGRNAGNTATVTTEVAPYVNDTISAVAITVLDNAPIDPATGLKIPTVAVGTDGGLSVIRDDGTVNNDTSFVSDTTRTIKRIRFNARQEIESAFYTTPNGHGGVAIYDAKGTWLRGYAAKTTVNNYKAGTLAAPNAYFTANGASLVEPQALAGNAMATKFYSGSWQPDGVTVVHENPVDPTKSMRARITDRKNTGWMVGDIQGAYLCETETGALTAPELVTNGGFDSDLTGWTDLTGESGVVSGKLHYVKTTATWDSVISDTFTVTAGRMYKLSYTTTNHSGNSARVVVKRVSSGNEHLPTAHGDLDYIGYFTATTDSLYLEIATANSATVDVEFDNISVKEVVADHSGKGNHLDIMGSLNRAVVGSGQIAFVEGFNDGGTDQYQNYLRGKWPATIGLDDFYVAGWAVWGSSFDIAFSTAAPNNSDHLTIRDYDSNGMRLMIHDGTTVSAISEGAPRKSGDLLFLSAERRSGVFYFYVNNRLIGSAAKTIDINAITDGYFKLGSGRDPSGDASWKGKLGEWHIVKGTISDDQRAKKYRDELAMIQGKAVLDGGSADVKAVAYDRERDLVHAANASVVSSFRGLERVKTVTPAVGTITALDASNGGLSIAGTNGVDLSLPAVSIRERLAQALRSPGRMTEDFYFTADGVTPSFALPKGWKPKRVAKDRYHQRVGANEDYTVTFDGFVYSVKFPIAPAINTEIDVEAVSV